MRRRNVIAGIVLLLFGAGYAFLTAHLPTRALEGQTEPSFFPWVVVTCLLLLSAALLIQGLISAANNRLPNSPRIPPLKYAIGFVSVIAYLIFLPQLGFLAANIPLFLVLMLLYGERRPIWLTAGSVGISVVLFFLFREGFRILLPSGILEGVIS